MPAHGYEVEKAEREGILFHPSTGPKRVLGVDGKVVGLETVRCASVFDSDGRFNPRFETGSESLITTDSIILSVGQHFLDAERCILCGGCVDICPYQCISMISASHVDWSDAADDFHATARRGEGYAMVLDETSCIRCGLCVRRCPTSAIAMRRFVSSGEWVYE